MEHYLIETKIGCIYGRDAIYLDEINHNYAKRKLKFVGEINGACYSGTDDESFVFQGGAGSTYRISNSFGTRIDAKLIRINKLFGTGNTTNYQVTGGLVFWF